MSNKIDDSLFDDENIHPESKETPSGNISDIPYVAGLVDVASSSFVDELAGGLSAVARPFGIEGLGGNLEDVSLVKPTLDLETLKNTYTKYRDLERKRQSEASDKPGYTAGQVTGIFASPLNKIVGPLEKISKLRKAGTLSQRAMNTAKLAGIGGGIGAIEGLGRSDSDSLDDVSSDVLSGAALGAAFPVGFGVLKEGVNLAGTTAKAALPNKMKELVQRAYDRGQENIDVIKKEFLPESLQSVSKVSDEIADPLMKKAQTFENARKIQINKINGLIDNKENQIKKIQDTYNNAAELLKKSQQQGNEKLSDTLEKQLVVKSKELNSKINSLREDIKKQYDVVDEMMKDSNVKINTSSVIDDFLKNVSDLGEGVISSKKLEKIQSLNGDLDFTDFMRLKGEIDSLSNNSDFGVKGLARKAYGNLRSTQQQSLVDQGREDIANLMTNANRRWTGYHGVQDVMESGINKNNVTNSVEAAVDSTKAIRRLSGDKAEDQIINEQLKNSAKLMGMSEPDLDVFNKFSNELKATKEFSPIMVPKPDEMIENNPFMKQRVSDMNEEIGLLKDQVKEANVKSDIEQLYSPFSGTPQEARDKVSGILESRKNPFITAAKAAQDQDFVSMVKQNIPEPQFQGLMSKADRSIDDLELARLMNREFDNVPISKFGVLNAALGGITKPTANMANRMGRMTNNNKIKPMLDLFNKARSSDTSKVVRSTIAASALSDEKKYTPIVNDSPEKLIQKANDIVANNPTNANQMVAEKLNKAAGQDSVGKAAQLFDLQQRKEGRDALSNSSDDMDDSLFED